jgi:hypothetical protein
MRRTCWWCDCSAPEADMVTFYGKWECQDVVACRLRMRKAMRKQEARR